MALEIPLPNEHPLTYCMHESDWALCKRDITELKTNLKVFSQELDSLKLDNAVYKELILTMKISVDQINKSVTDMEIQLASHSGNNKWIERLVWAIVGCIISGCLTMLIKTI